MAGFGPALPSQRAACCQLHHMAHRGGSRRMGISHHRFEGEHSMSAHPKGVGVYARGAAIRPDTLRAARCRWAAIMVESVDGRVVPLSDLHRQCDRARKGGARSIWLWALHGPKAAGEPKAAAERLTRHLAPLSADGVILDIEAAHKGKPLLCRDLVIATIDGLTERTGLGVTSFPTIKAHPTMPWAEMRAGWGSPQLYSSAGSEPRSRASVEDWRAWWPSVEGAHHGRSRVIIPSLAAYETTSPGEGAAQLRGDLERVCMDDGVVDVPGICLWSEPQLSLTEAIEVGQFAERVGW